MARSLFLVLLSLAVWVTAGICLAAPRVYRATPQPEGARGYAGAPSYSDGRATYAPLPDPSPPLQLTTWVRPGMPISGSVAAFSPDGKRLATGNARQGAVCLWEMRGGSARILEAWPQGDRGQVEALAFSPNGRLLAAAMGPEGVTLWDAPSGRVVATLPDAQGPIAFAPDGTRLATSGGGRCGDAARLWDPRSGVLLARLQGMAPAHGLLFSPDGRTLASEHGWVKDRYTAGTCLWSGRTGEPRQTIWNEGGALAFAPNGRDLWIGERCIALSPGVRTAPETRAPWARTYPCWPMAFSPDGRTVVCSGPESWPMVADTRTGVPRGVMRGRLHLRRAEILLAAVLTAVLLMLVPLLVGRIGRRCTGRHPALVWATGVGGCLVSPVVAVAVVLAVWWPLQHAQAERMMYPVVFSPDSRHIATADAAGKVRLWRTSSGRKEAEASTGRGRATGVLFSPDGSLLAATDRDADVSLWRAQ